MRVSSLNMTLEVGALEPDELVGGPSGFSIMLSGGSGGGGLEGMGGDIGFELAFEPLFPPPPPPPPPLLKWLWP